MRVEISNGEVHVEDVEWPWAAYDVYVEGHQPLVDVMVFATEGEPYVAEWTGRSRRLPPEVAGEIESILATELQRALNDLAVAAARLRDAEQEAVVTTRPLLLTARR